MNKWKKLGLAAGMGTAAFTTAHIINQCIFQAAVSDKITENKSILKYKWRLEMLPTPSVVRGHRSF